MATAPDLFQIIYSFSPVSGGSLPLGPSPRYGLIEEPQISPRAQGSIVLPNGSKYDPHQSYDSPLTPKELIVRRILKPVPTEALEDTEASITSWYNSNIVARLGQRGTLYGTAYYIPNSSATARLLQATLDWSLPRQIVTNIGGLGNATPGIKTALLTLTFDMLTEWTY